MENDEMLTFEEALERLIALRSAEFAKTGLKLHPYEVAALVLAWRTMFEDALLDGSVPVYAVCDKPTEKDQ